ncbi:MAG TPA: DUF378 domain-containing protein [Candidatus Paceibacterota bacterium]
MKGLHIVFWILLVIGGLNWLLVGVAGWDVGVLFGGQDAIISRVIYVLVGIAAIAELFGHKKNCSACKSGSDMSAPM